MGKTTLQALAVRVLSTSTLCRYDSLGPDSNESYVSGEDVLVVFRVPSIRFLEPIMQKACIATELLHAVYCIARQVEEAWCTAPCCLVTFMAVHQTASVRERSGCFASNILFQVQLRWSSTKSLLLSLARGPINSIEAILFSGKNQSKKKQWNQRTSCIPNYRGDCAACMHAWALIFVCAHEFAFLKALVWLASLAATREGEAFYIHRTQGGLSMQATASRTVAL
eukprot:5150528-Amphidinium_carterae.1